MTFNDLPDDWATRSITEPGLVADVLDLLVSDADRQQGALVLALCDADGRLVQPMAIGEMGDAIHTGADSDVLRMFLEAVGTRLPVAALLVAVARPGGLSITAGDRAWLAAAEQACAGGIRLLGVHVVTADGSREVPAARAA